MEGMLDFYRTMGGRRFIDGTMPRIAASLAEIADALKAQRVIADDLSPHPRMAAHCIDFVTRYVSWYEGMGHLLTADAGNFYTFYRSACEALERAPVFEWDPTMSRVIPTKA